MHVLTGILVFAAGVFWVAFGAAGLAAAIVWAIGFVVSLAASLLWLRAVELTGLLQWFAVVGVGCVGAWHVGALLVFVAAVAVGILAALLIAGDHP